MPNRVRAAAWAVAGVAVVALTGCSPQLGDRGGENGAPPDRISDVEYVEVFRNADRFPNIARVCVAGLGFASSSSPVGQSAGGAPIIRVPEWDEFCADPPEPAPQPGG